MKKFVLFLVDVALLYTSLALTLLLRYGRLDSQLWQEHLGPFSLVFSIWVIVFFINGLYEIRKAENDFKFFGHLIQNLAINALLAVLFFYLILGRFSYLKPQTILLILLVLFTVHVFLVIELNKDSSVQLNDNVDYDGMGNYGRFPPIEKVVKKRKLHVQKVV